MSAATHTIEGTSAHTQFTPSNTSRFGDETAMHHQQHRQQVDEASDGKEAIEASESAKVETDAIVSESGGVERIVDYCADPEQAITNYRLIGVAGLMTVIILVQSAFCFALYLRRPDRIVVDRTQGGDRVVVMNDREYGYQTSGGANMTANVSVSKCTAAYALAIGCGREFDCGWKGDD